MQLVVATPPLPVVLLNAIGPDTVNINPGSVASPCSHAPFAFGSSNLNILTKPQFCVVGVVVLVVDVVTVVLVVVAVVMQPLVALHAWPDCSAHVFSVHPNALHLVSPDVHSFVHVTHVIVVNDFWSLSLYPFEL